MIFVLFFKSARVNSIKKLSLSFPFLFEKFYVLPKVVNVDFGAIRTFRFKTTFLGIVLICPSRFNV